MTGLEWPLALFLLANLCLALIVVERGPGAADRMLAALLLGTTGTAVLAVLALAMPLAALFDVALVLALLAAIGGIAFAKRAWQETRHD